MSRTWPWEVLLEHNCRDGYRHEPILHAGTTQTRQIAVTPHLAPGLCLKNVMGTGVWARMWERGEIHDEAEALEASAKGYLEKLHVT